MRYKNGGIIGKVATTSSDGPPANASGVWSLGDQSNSNLSSTWPPLYFPPTAPTSVSAVANGFTAADVTYSGEVTYGPSPTFTATSTPGSFTGTGASPITVSGLTSGTSYTFTVTVDDVGGSATSSASSPITIPSPSDTYWTSVSLLVDGNGNLEDESNNSHSITNSSTSIETSTVKFGSGSLGMSSASFSINNSDFAFGTGDFTVEGWMYASGSMSVAGICSTVPTSSTTDNGFMFGLYQGKLTFATQDSVTQLSANTSNYTFPTSGWYHVAITRNSGSVRYFVDGTQRGTTKSNTANVSNTSYHVGRLLNDSSSFSWNGFFDEFRVTKGVARYTSNFTAPTAEFPRS